MDALRGDPSPVEENPKPEPKLTSWKHLRLLTIAALILATCSTAAYQIGILQSRKPEVADVRAAVPVARTTARLEPPAPHHRWRRRRGCRQTRRNLPGCEPK